MKQTMKFNGKVYQRKAQHRTKLKAKETARMYRNVGAKARVIKEVTKNGILWIVYRRG